MKISCFLVLALAVTCALSSCVHVTPYEYSSTLSCCCQHRSCTPVRMQTWTSRQVSRHPTTWGAPVTVTVTVTTSYH